MIDFKDININEELAIVESAEMVATTSLADRVAARRKSADEGIRTPWQKLDGDFALRKGEMVLMGGYTGHFKSTIASQMGLSAVNQGYSEGIASLELLAEDVLEQYAELAAGRERPPLEYVSNFATWAEPKLHIYDRVDAIAPDSAIQMVIAFAKYKKCDLIVLDALMMMGVCDDLEREKDFTQTLAAVAKKFKVCVLLIHHVRKPSGHDGEKHIPGKYDFIGSSHLANIAASIIVIWHNKEKAYKKNDGYIVDDDNPDLIFKVAKQRYHKYEGLVGLWQHDNCRAFCGTSRRKLDQLTIPAVGAHNDF